jgi:putative peptidoglycan lipid II flippase
MLFFVLPSTILLMMMRMDIVRLIYQRGAFGVYDTWITSEVLMGYLWGLPFYSLYALLSRAEYARIDGKKIAFFATAIMVITNVVLDLTLGLRIGPYGVALATSIAGMAGCTVLIVDLVRNGFLRVSRVDLLSMGKIGLAGLGIGLVLLGTSYWDYSFLNVFIRIFIGGLSYLGILLCLRHHDSVRLVRKIIRR